MSLEARISPIWRKQKLFIAVFFWAVALWFLWDGWYKWPRENIRFLAHNEHPNDWKEFAHSQGWTETVPHKLHTASDLRGQYFCAALAGVLGTLLFAYWLTQKNRTLRADDTAVYTPNGNRVPFESIIGVGKKQWETKGLATVRYQEEGRQRQFVVDDYKFEAEPTHQILAAIEDRLVARTPSGTP